MKPGVLNMGYSLDPIADNCYPDTTILIKKLNIKDEALLNEVEATLVSAKTAIWEGDPLYCTFEIRKLLKK